MSDTVTQLSLTGAVFQLPNPTDGEVTLDFAAFSQDAALVAVTDWWDGQWGLQNGIHRIAGRWVADGTVFRCYDRPDGIVCAIRAPEDRNLQNICAANRLRTDIERIDYRDALDKLAAFAAGDFDLTEWISAIDSRPTIDAVQYLTDQLSRKRQVGRFILKDASGQKIGALVVDEDGNSATAGGDPWLDTIAGEFRDQTPHPPLADFVNWAVSLTPHTGNVPSNPAVIEDAGMVDEIASRILFAQFP